LSAPRATLQHDKEVVDVTQMFCSDCKADTLFVTPECLDGHDDCPDLMCDTCGLAMMRVAWLVTEDVVLVEAA
jgi:hypothetical protein